MDSGQQFERLFGDLEQSWWLSQSAPSLKQVSGFRFENPRLSRQFDSICAGCDCQGSGFIGCRVKGLGLGTAGSGVGVQVDISIAARTEGQDGFKLSLESSTRN